MLLRLELAAGHPPYAYASSYVDRSQFDGDLMGIKGTPVRSQRTTAGSRASAGARDLCYERFISQENRSANGFLVCFLGV